MPAKSKKDVTITTLLFPPIFGTEDDFVRRGDLLALSKLQYTPTDGVMTNDPNFNTKDWSVSVASILETPKATNVEESRHGQWIDSDEQGYFRKHYHTKVCSICRKKKEGNWNYCPQCGAKMVDNKD